jgi:predicted nucleic acid-binding protein
MSADRFTLDANILFYSVDEDAGAKRQRAIEILTLAPRQNCVLTLQSLGEFYATLTRKKPGARKLASDHVKDWLDIFPIVAASPQALAAALPFADSGQLSFWDALLLMTAREAGCAVVLSEDMGDGARVAGIKVRDPFAGPDLPGDIRKLLGLSQSS